MKIIASLIEKVPKFTKENYKWCLYTLAFTEYEIAPHEWHPYIKIYEEMCFNIMNCKDKFTG